MVTRMMGPLNVMGMGKNTYTLLTELASYPLTVLWALQQAAKSCLSAGLSSPEDMTSLVIHVVGAELPFECIEAMSQAACSIIKFACLRF